MITFRQLKEALNELRDEHLDMTASISYQGEILPIKECILAGEHPDQELLGVVAEDQPLLVIA